MAQPEIVSLGETLAWLGLGSAPAAADAGFVQLLKGLVENQVRAYCGHNITRTAIPYVAYLPAPTGTLIVDPLLRNTDAHEARGAADVLPLPQIFVPLDGLEVREDPNGAAGQADAVFGSETLLTRGVDYFLDVDETGLSRSGHLVRLHGSWPARPGSVQATFQAGLTSAELDGPFSDLKLAVLEEIALRFRDAQLRNKAVGTSSAIRSESIGGEYTVTYETAAEPANIGLADATRERLAPYVRLVP